MSYIRARSENCKSAEGHNAMNHRAEIGRESRRTADQAIAQLVRVTAWRDGQIHEVPRRIARSESLKESSVNLHEAIECLRMWCDMMADEQSEVVEPDACDLEERRVIEAARIVVNAIQHRDQDTKSRAG